ncbi:hypothetical protein [Nonomuraea rhodomycinica]|uniref:Uncharacterized protein n=1 Tax=Nonomuraea rhodomycinica TaxID=1712872 RepID=A0A7Y6MEQ0_9ACTN|nr:hypothetical protein [Nonomuraea rhodomycinica]NUW45783.1 hypothetical protein [Nonomuraea rhodomycinica]
MWSVIVGALSALAGVALGQFMQGRREAQGRSYDHRREAHVDFLKSFDHYWDIAARHNPYDEGPAPCDFEADDFDGLYKRLLTVRVFASPSTHRAAEMATKELMAFFGANGKGDQGPLSSAFDEYLRLMRKELGVQ